MSRQSELIKRKRKELNLTYEEIARKVFNTDRPRPSHLTTIYGWESGRLKRGVCPKRVMAICGALEIDFEEIINDMTMDYKDRLVSTITGGENA
jgi:transcriptional regulator with XRE-family HTH domain